MHMQRIYAHYKSRNLNKLLMENLVYFVFELGLNFFCLATAMSRL